MRNKLTETEELIWLTLNEAGVTEDEINYFLFGDGNADENSVQSKSIWEINNQNNELQKDIENLKKEISTYRYDASFGKKQVQENIDDMNLFE